MKPWLDDGDVRLYHGDALATLEQMPSGSVDCIITSPPYYGLRDYGTGEWGGGDEACDHKPRPERGARELVRREGLPGKALTSWTERDGTTYGNGCGKCGATRRDEQYGLEATPDEHVAVMVRVFREARRVLADHGTLWLNYGDSYNAYNGGRGPSDSISSTADQARNEPPRGLTAPLPAKNLLGMPWRVARALQEPYYTGRIRDERDRIWLAAMVDAEGCMFIHKRKAGQSNGQGYERKNASYGAGLEVSSTDRVIVERCLAIAGIGSVCEQTPTQNDRRKQTLYRWNLRSNECREVIRELYPHLVAKQHEARLVLGCPSSGPDAEKAHESLKAIHQGQTPGIDFAPPESMFEAGWCLRSDIIWAKCIPNPMPESVTDRPTKAHEYVFLFSKRPRYWYDADAVREGEQVYHRKAGGYRDHAGQMVNGIKPFQGKGGFADSDITTVGRNARSVWEIATQPTPEAHFATFPEELVRRCLLAGCPTQVCRVCGKPRERIVERTAVPHWKGGSVTGSGERGDYGANGSPRFNYDVSTLGFTDCCHHAYRPGVVLDPFIGSATTALVARKHGRHAIGIELNADYLAIAARRLQQLSLLAEEPA